MSIRKEAVETATLAVLQLHLLTKENARIFVEEYRRESDRLARESESVDDRDREPLKQVERELANLAQNMLAGVLSPTLARMLEKREAEKVRLEAQLASGRQAPPLAEILPHPVLRARFEEKVANLRASLGTDAVRPGASQILSRLLEGVTIYRAVRLSGGGDRSAEGAPVVGLP